MTAQGHRSPQVLAPPIVNPLLVTISNRPFPTLLKVGEAAIALLVLPPVPKPIIPKQI